MHILKKYPNRRIYHTGKSSYITLADVRRMVSERENFQVLDSKTGEDLTRSVLLQIIAEMEAEGHASVLTNRVLEELIRFYDHRMVSMMGPLLERQIVDFLGQQDRLQEQLRTLTGGRMPDMTDFAQPNTVIEAMTRQYQDMLRAFTGASRPDEKKQDEGGES